MELSKKNDMDAQNQCEIAAPNACADCGRALGAVQSVITDNGRGLRQRDLQEVRSRSGFGNVVNLNKED